MTETKEKTWQEKRKRKEMIRRHHRPINPRVSLDTDITNINCFLPRHVKVEGYNPQPAMKLPVAV